MKRSRTPATAVGEGRRAAVCASRSVAYATSTRKFSEHRCAASGVGKPTPASVPPPAPRPPLPAEIFVSAAARVRKIERATWRAGSRRSGGPFVVPMR